MIKYLPQTIFPCMVAICFDEKSYNKEVSKLTDRKDFNDGWEFVGGSAAARTHNFLANNGNRINIICIKEIIQDIDCMGVIAHEIAHVVDFIFEDFGVENIDYELRAYLTQFLTVHSLDIIDDYFKKATKKKRKK